MGDRRASLFLLFCLFLSVHGEDNATAAATTAAATTAAATTAAATTAAPPPSDLTMTVDPDNIQIGLTQALTVNCSYVAPPGRQLVNIFIRYMKENTTTLVDLASMNGLLSGKVTYIEKSENFDLVDQFESTGSSYLTAVWKYPDAKKARQYTCSVSSADQNTGKVEEIKDTKSVSSSKPTVDGVADAFRQAMQKLDDMQQKFEDLQKKLDMLLAGGGSSVATPQATTTAMVATTTVKAQDTSTTKAEAAATTTAAAAAATTTPPPTTTPTHAVTTKAPNPGCPDSATQAPASTAAHTTSAPLLTTILLTTTPLPATTPLSTKADTTIPAQPKNDLSQVFEIFIRFPSKYYLSKNRYEDFDTSQAICKQYGANLVKIDSDVEYKSLTDFFNRFSATFSGFLTGATARDNPGYWVYPAYGNAGMRFMDWADGEPNQINNLCMVVYRAEDGTTHMRDFPCVNDMNGRRLGYNVAFMCEAPYS